MALTVYDLNLGTQVKTVIPGVFTFSNSKLVEYFPSTSAGGFNIGAGIFRMQFDFTSNNYFLYNDPTDGHFAIVLRNNYAAITGSPPLVHGQGMIIGNVKNAVRGHNLSPSTQIETWFHGLRTDVPPDIQDASNFLIEGSGGPVLLDNTKYRIVLDAVRTSTNGSFVRYQIFPINPDLSSGTRIFDSTLLADNNIYFDPTQTGVVIAHVFNNVGAPDYSATFENIIFIWDMYAPVVPGGNTPPEPIMPDPMPVLPPEVIDAGNMASTPVMNEGGGVSFRVQRLGDVNSAGAQIENINTTNKNVYCNNLLVSVNGSNVASHGGFFGRHRNVKTNNGSSKIFIENKPVNFETNLDTCSHPRVRGSSNTFIGSPASASEPFQQPDNAVFEGVFVEPNVPPFIPSTDAFGNLIAFNQATGLYYIQRYENVGGSLVPVGPQIYTDAAGNVLPSVNLSTNNDYTINPNTGQLEQAPPNVITQVVPEGNPLA